MMKNFFALSVAAVFFCMFSVTAQELPVDEGVAARPGEGEASSKTAEELFPYIRKPATNIDRKDYGVSLDRTEKIVFSVEKNLLPDQKAREIYIANALNGLEEKYRSKDKNLSNEQFVTEIVNAAMENLAKDTKERLQFLEEDVSKSILKGASASPAGKAVEAERAKSREAVKNLVEQRFSTKEKEIRTKLEAQARKEYPLYKKGQKVVITYKVGRAFYQAKGTFYGFGIGGRSILINSRSIPKRDLSPEDRARFDEKENQRVRQQYVENGMRRSQMEKFRYEMNLVNAHLKKQIAENDRKGFIYYGMKDEKKVAEVVDFRKKANEKFDYNVLTPEEQLKFYTNKWVSAATIIKDLAADMINITKKRVQHELQNAVSSEVAKIALKLEQEKNKQSGNQNSGGENMDAETDAQEDLPE